MSDVNLIAVVRGATLRIQAILRQQRKGQPIRSVGALLGGLMMLAQSASALSVAVQPNPRTLQRAEVIRVINLNTVLVQYFDQPDAQVVKLIGIQAAEPANPIWTQLTKETPVAVYNAGQYLQDTINHREVYLETDPGIRANADIPAVYLWRNHQLINQDLLLKGHGLVAPDATKLKYGDFLSEAEAVARKQGRGLWTFFGPKPAGIKPASNPIQRAPGSA